MELSLIGFEIQILPAQVDRLSMGIMPLAIRDDIVFQLLFDRHATPDVPFLFEHFGEDSVANHVMAYWVKSNLIGWKLVARNS